MRFIPSSSAISQKLALLMYLEHNRTSVWKVEQEFADEIIHVLCFIRLVSNSAMSSELPIVSAPKN